MTKLPATHPDPQAQALDDIAFAYSGARQLIRFATPAEEMHFRRCFPARVFNLLVVVVTKGDRVDCSNFFALDNPTGETPLLPSDPEIIAHIAAGRCVLARSNHGLEVSGYQEGTTAEFLRAAMQAPSQIGGDQ